MSDSCLRCTDEMDQSNQAGTSSNMIQIIDSETEGEDYLSQICRANSNNNGNTAEAEHVDHVDSDACPTPSKIPKRTADFESSLEQQVFNENMLSTSSPRVDTNVVKAEQIEKPATIPSANDQICIVNETSQDSMEAHKVIGSHSSEAEEIVKKLCKNGKIMQFQESEDFIKVIVYEDSQESNDLDDTLSAEESENSANGNEKKAQASSQTKNLLECLTENTASVNRSFEGLSSTPMQHFPISGHYPSPAGDQQHFIHPALQAIPTSYSSSGDGNMIQSNNLISHCNNAAVPLALHSSQQCTPHPRNGFMYYRPSDAQHPRLLPSASSTPTHKTQAIHTGHMLNSSGEEVISPTEITQTPSSSRAKMQSKVRALMEPPSFPGDDWGKIREQHNQKERRRRARIKEACNLLRQLVPGMSDKTDKATVFEFAARYVHYLKTHTGTQFDKDFLMKYSPY